VDSGWDWRMLRVENAGCKVCMSSELGVVDDEVVGGVGQAEQEA
jgi:hypothetical protein